MQRAASAPDPTNPLPPNTKAIGFRIKPVANRGGDRGEPGMGIVAWFAARAPGAARYAEVARGRQELSSQLPGERKLPEAFASAEVARSCQNLAGSATSEFCHMGNPKP